MTISEHENSRQNAWSCFFFEKFKGKNILAPSLASGEQRKNFLKGHIAHWAAADESILGFSAWENDKTVANISASLPVGQTKTFFAISSTHFCICSNMNM